jgi:pyridoxine kinase
MAQPTSPPASAPLVYSISSHVSLGSVGNRAAVFALEALGVRACAVHTVQLPFHPGHGPAPRVALAASELRELLFQLWANRDFDRPSAILTGYFAATEQVVAVAEFVAKAKSKNPGLLVVCDPVIGDADGLYVAADTAEAIRDQLLRAADVATPNRHELAWLVNDDPAARIERAESQARRLGPAEVLVTSAPSSTPNSLANLLIDGRNSWVAEHPILSGPRNGPGDLIAALYCGHRALGRSAHDSLRRATAGVIGVMRRSPPIKNAELLLAGSQHEVHSPTATILVRPVGRAPAS